jgi:ferric-dicitrate binding protein FerR (iron transport regulator)
MTKVDIRRIITKYLNQEGSEDDLTILYDWVIKANNKEVFKKIVLADFLINYKNESWETEEAFKQFLEEIKEKERKKIKFLHSNNDWLKYAAAVLVLIASSAYFLFNTDTSKEALPEVNLNQVTLQLDNGEVIILNENGNSTIKGKEGNVVASVVKGVLLQKAKEGSKNSKRNNVLYIPYGKNMSVELEDGTKVVLNSGSTLTYPSSFTGKSRREVRLIGEAFFEVSPNPDKPFIVRTENLNTQVFGTVFNVSAYDDDASVVLVEGSVGVTTENGAFPNIVEILKPSQKASNNKDGFVIEDVDVAAHISWTKGVITFESEEMSQIIKTLQRQFNVAIVNQYKELDKIRFTGMFDEDNIDIILKTIQVHTPFAYKLENDTITISKP